MIGKLEEIVLLGCLRAGAAALPSDIYLALTDANLKSLASFASVYTTLGRLAKKGFLAEIEKEGEGGRQRRAFTVTGSGQKALAEALNASHSLGGHGAAGGVYA